jgi:hypothetical protein
VHRRLAPRSLAGRGPRPAVLRVRRLQSARSAAASGALLHRGLCPHPGLLRGQDVRVPRVLAPAGEGRRHGWRLNPGPPLPPPELDHTLLVPAGDDAAME